MEQDANPALRHPIQDRHKPGLGDKHELPVPGYAVPPGQAHQTHQAHQAHQAHQTHQTHQNHQLHQLHQNQGQNQMHNQMQLQNQLQNQIQPPPQGGQPIAAASPATALNPAQLNQQQQQQQQQISQNQPAQATLGRLHLQAPQAPQQPQPPQQPQIHQLQHMQDGRHYDLPLLEHADAPPQPASPFQGQFAPSRRGAGMAAYAPSLHRTSVWQQRGPYFEGNGNGAGDLSQGLPNMYGQGGFLRPTAQRDPVPGPPQQGQPPPQSDNYPGYAQPNVYLGQNMPLHQGPIAPEHYHDPYATAMSEHPAGAGAAGGPGGLPNFDMGGAAAAAAAMNRNPYPSGPAAAPTARRASSTKPYAGPGRLSMQRERALSVSTDAMGVTWIDFSYTRNRTEGTYHIRCDIDKVDGAALTARFKQENCIYPRAMVPPEDYRGHRQKYETECNEIGWKLAFLNPELQRHRGVIQRAVDSYRNTSQDLSIRSRRARRLARRQSDAD